MTAAWDSVVVDATDPARLGRWWAEVLDFHIVSEEPGEVVVGPGGDGPELVFVAVPEIKAVKNRLHLDLRPGPGSSQEAEVERVVDMGAHRVDVGQRDDSPQVVLADPEGNEFCVLRAKEE